MQAHPVPQNITGFEFKLVGFLTIRQFGYVAAAGIASFIIYILPLFAIIKIALILPLALLGLALAFLPINDIPFDRWIVSFVRSVYSPTKLVWHKEPKEIGFLAPEFSIYLGRQKAPVRAKADRRRLQAFLNQKKTTPHSVLDAQEEKRLSDISSQASVIGFGYPLESTGVVNRQEVPNNLEVVGDVTVLNKLSHGQ